MAEIDGLGPACASSISSFRRRWQRWLWLSAMLLFSSATQASQTCTAALSEFRKMLGDENYPLMWEETGMSDGKPLVISISEKGGVLFFQFVKSKEGLWAEGSGVICRTGTSFQLLFAPGQLSAGPAANWAMSLGLRGGNAFSLSPNGADQLQIAGVGWHGTFAPTRK